ncbi:MAG TPA: S41 family peptidase [Anaerolineales bacterium]
MKHFKRLPIVAFLVLSLACNFLTRAFSTTAVPTNTPIVTPAATGSVTQPAGLYIPPGCENVAAATLPAPTELAIPTPAAQANPVIDHALQQRVFNEAVDVVTRVYVHPNYNGTNWPAAVATERAKVEAGLTTEQFYNDMQDLIVSLADNHSRFDSPVDVAQSQAVLSDTGQFVGIGVAIIPEISKGLITITGIFPDSPAQHAGLKVHDSILSVDGLPLVQNGNVYTYRVRGPECSAEVLRVQSPGEAPRNVLLMRHKIAGDLPVESQIVSTKDGSRVGYIMVPSFFDEKIPGEVADALQRFGHLDGLILDNRANPGGSSTVVEPVLSYFASGTLGQFKSRTDSRPLTIQPNPIGNSQTVPLVVLVGKDTASFGEIFSGVLQDSGRAKIVGQTTPGIVEILHGYNFEDGSRLWIAQETFDPAVSHANWEGKGIVPDVQAYADWGTFTFANDPGVLAALKLLGHG